MSEQPKKIPGTLKRRLIIGLSIVDVASLIAPLLIYSLDTTCVTGVLSAALIGVIFLIPNKNSPQ